MAAFAKELAAGNEAQCPMTKKRRAYQPRIVGSKVMV
jgi:hypothetical protein